MKQKKSSFYLDFSKVLIKLSLVPISLAFLLAFLAIISLYRFTIHYNADQRCKVSALRLESSVNAYLEKVESLSADPRLVEILSGNRPAYTLAEELYGFTNDQNVSAAFFLLDDRADSVLGSYKELSPYLDAEPPFYAGMVYRMTNAPDKTVLMLNNAGSTRAKAMQLSVGRAIVSGEKIVGYLVFELDPDTILEYITGSGIGEIVVADAYYNTLLASKSTFLDRFNRLKTDYRDAKGLVRGSDGEFYVTAGEAGDTGLSVYVFVDQMPLRQSLYYTSLLTLILLAVLLAVNLGITRRMAQSETRSIDQLISNLRRMQSEGIYTELPVPSGGVFSSLEESYTQLIEEIRALVQANKQEMLLRTTAEIKQLESQFNPHFIFNTLEVIRCLIKLSPADAERMILNFSALLRYSIDNSVQTVSLADDLRYIDHYLSMVQMRRTIRLEYAISLEPGTENCVVPKLCMQPIVENSVKYVTDRRKSLKIDIKAYANGDRLLLEIRDDGNGIPPEQLEDIRATLQKESLPDKYFGLYNVHRRIRLMYGVGYGLRIDSRLGEGTTVTAELPLHGRDSNDQGAAR